MNRCFCCCDSCGSIDWIDEEGGVGVNALDSRGNLLEKKDYNLISFATGFPLCQSCEKVLKLISFKEVGIQQRKKIFKMTQEERIKWVKSFWMCKSLENEGFEI